MGSNRTVNFLKNNPTLFRFSDIEAKTGIPASTLSRVIKGERELSAEHEKKIKGYLIRVRAGLARFLEDD